MRLHAPAKINWTLEVLGRRDDGYHEISSVLQTIDLADVLELAPADTLRLEVRDYEGSEEENLALEAARLLRVESGWSGGAMIRLTKRIPVAAGLGGGSSDAAAVLRGLNDLWSLGWPAERLAALAAKVSSAAPFFVPGGTALVQARGERVAGLPDLAPRRLALMVPPWSLPQKTGSMYARLEKADFVDGGRSQRFVEALRSGQEPGEEFLYNCFHRAAYEVWPDLARYRDVFLAAGARRVHLAGSGPALFVLAHGEEQAKAFQARLRSLPGVALVAGTLDAKAATRLEA
jgi:4-diphosphocytidyl-2-C-methyl-D-erythritol kinase